MFGSKNTLLLYFAPSFYFAFFLLLFKKIVQVFSYIINRILGGEEIVDVFCTFACDICTKTHYGRGNLQDFINNSSNHFTL